MSNIVTTQILSDTTTHSIIKIVGLLDGTGEYNNASVIQANTLYGAIATNGYLVANNQGGAANTTLSYYDLQITRVNYNVSMPTPGHVDIYWQGGTACTAFALSRAGEYSVDQGLPSVTNTAATPNGDIGVSTHGATSNCSFTIVLELRKNNQMYQRGQFNDPAAFNYGQYKLQP